MTSRIVLSAEAEADVGEALAYLNDRNPVAASHLRVRIEQAIVALSENRFDGREVRVSDGRTVRRWVCAPFVIYRRKSVVLEVIRVLHSARKPIER